MHAQYWRESVQVRCRTVAAVRCRDWTESLAGARELDVSKKSAGARAVDSAAAPSRSDSAAPIDRAYLARFTLGSVELERDVLGLFADQAIVTLRHVREASTNQAWHLATHTLKGSAAAVGATRLAQLAELAERLDIEAHTAQSEQLALKAVAALEEAVEEACRYARQLCN